MPWWAGLWSWKQAVALAALVPPGPQQQHSSAFCPCDGGVVGSNAYSGRCPGSARCCPGSGSTRSQKGSAARRRPAQGSRSFLTRRCRTGAGGWPGISRSRCCWWARAAAGVGRRRGLPGCVSQTPCRQKAQAKFAARTQCSTAREQRGVERGRPRSSLRTEQRRAQTSRGGQRGGMLRTRGRGRPSGGA